MSPAPSASRTRTLVLLLVVYLALLTWLVLWKLDVPHVGRVADVPINLVPFDEGATEPLEFVGNIVMFVPLGLYVGLLLPAWPWWRAGLVAAAASLALEVGQFVLGLGIPDVTDLIANSAGGLIGIVLVLLARRTLGDRTEVVLTRVLAVATVVALVAVAVYLVSPLHYAPPDDVGPLSGR